MSGAVNKPERVTQNRVVKLFTKVLGYTFEGNLKDNINNYDLIFLDWEMPIKDGPTTFYELKELGLKTPVLMLTSKNDPKDIVKMIEAGVFDYLMKPFTQNIIEGKINLLFP